MSILCLDFGEHDFFGGGLAIVHGIVIDPV